MFFWLWIAVLIGSVVLEFATSTALVSIWFAAGALMGLVANQLGFSFGWQVILFFATSFIFLAIGRPYFSSYARGNIIPTNADRFIGNRYRLIKPITSENWGEVKIHSTIWNATTADQSSIDEGKMVEVIAFEGNKLLVKEVKENN
ncbi:MAG: NfeD family protein [Erysipelotrichaceae bacterium]|nr:NfeD family protein [Erysipelotrichaceae bacterium]